MIDRNELMHDIDMAFRNPNKRSVLQGIVNRFANEIDRLQEKEQSWRTAEFRFGEDDQPMYETSLPPIGMAIEVFSPDMSGEWEPAEIQQNLLGNYVIRVNERLYNMSKVKWRYKRAPKRWPEVTKSWLALSTGEYIYSRYLGWRDGQMINVDGIDRIAIILHVEHRPEKTSDD